MSEASPDLDKDLTCAIQSRKDPRYLFSLASTLRSAKTKAVIHKRSSAKELGKLTMSPPFFLFFPPNCNYFVTWSHKTRLRLHFQFWRGALKISNFQFTAAVAAAATRPPGSDPMTGCSLSGVKISNRLLNFETGLPRGQVRP